MAFTIGNAVIAFAHLLLPLSSFVCAAIFFAFARQPLRRIALRMPYGERVKKTRQILTQSNISGGTHDHEEHHQFIKLRGFHSQRLAGPPPTITTDSRTHLMHGQSRRHRAREMRLFLGKVFRSVDTDDSKTVSLTELRDALHINDTEFRALEIKFHSFDDDGSGELDEEEFISLVLKSSVGMQLIVGEIKSQLQSEDGFLVTKLPSSKRKVFGLFRRQNASDAAMDIRVDEQQTNSSSTDRPIDLPRALSEDNVGLKQGSGDDSSLRTHHSAISLTTRNGVQHISFKRRNGQWSDILASKVTSIHIHEHNPRVLCIASTSESGITKFGVENQLLCEGAVQAICSLLGIKVESSNTDA